MGGVYPQGDEGLDTGLAGDFRFHREGFFKPGQFGYSDYCRSFGQFGNSGRQHPNYS